MVPAERYLKNWVQNFRKYLQEKNIHFNASPILTERDINMYMELGFIEALEETFDVNFYQFLDFVDQQNK